MSNLFETQANAKVVNPQIGSYKGKKKVSIEFEIVDGDHKGKRVSYDGKLDDDNIKYTKRAMRAVGWTSNSAGAFPAEAMAAAKGGLVVLITTRIASYEKDGKLREWTAVDRIGDSALELNKLDADELANVDRWFAAAGDDESPPPSNGYGSGRGAPPPDDADLPF